LRERSENLENLSDLESLIIDTSVLIEYSKVKRLELLDGSNISFVTLLEFLRYYKNERTRKRIKALLEDFFKIITLDNDIALVYCDLYNKLKERGTLIDDADLLIASSAIAKNMTLFTLNLKHFERLAKFGLKLWRW